MTRDNERTRKHLEKLWIRGYDAGIEDAKSNQGEISTRSKKLLDQSVSDTVQDITQ